MTDTKKPRKELKRKTRIRRQSPKKAAASRSSGTRTGMMRRKSGTKRKPRSADETLRIYGPDEFREWLHTRSCAVCGAGGVEQAHAKGDGVARKADWTFTLPLCRARFDYEGCHRQLHRVGVKTFEKDRGVSLLALAELTQKRWQSHLSTDHDTAF